MPMFVVKLSKSTCSSEVHWISWRARSIPSFEPMMVIMSLFSFGPGMLIFVAEVNSKAANFCPFVPRINRWWSLGIRISCLAYKFNKIQHDIPSKKPKFLTPCLLPGFGPNIVLYLPVSEVVEQSSFVHVAQHQLYQLALRSDFDLFQSSVQWIHLNTLNV